LYSSDDEGHEEVVWQFPETVPACISLHLKTCCLEGYKGSADELLKCCIIVFIIVYKMLYNCVYN